MTALAADRNTPRRDGDLVTYPVAASTTIYAGALVVMDAGYAKPGTVDTGLVAVGRAEARVDNSSGSNGDLDVTVRHGVFRWANSAAADAIALSEVGSTCYIVDDQTVAKTDGSSARSAAGTVVDVDAQGVWVRTE